MVGNELVRIIDKFGFREKVFLYSVMSGIHRSFISIS
jgi:hypothetical protein